MQKLLTIGIALIFPLFALANGVALKKNYPTTYLVKPGDTIWSIASKYLDHPWQWREILENNPSIQHPDRIYPGDVLHLRRVNGAPKIAITHSGTIRLSPKIRKDGVTNAIPAIPINDIKPFIYDIMILSEGKIDKIPYIVTDPDERITLVDGDTAFVIGLKDKTTSDFALYRVIDKLDEPRSKKLIAYKAVHVGNARVINHGNPAKVEITSIEQDVQQGDLLIPNQEHLYTQFYVLPHPPKHKIKGHVLSAPTGELTRVGLYDVITVGVGTKDNLDVGTVLEVRRPAHRVRNPIKDREPQYLEIPSRKVGTILLFRTFEHVSLGLLMETINEVTLDDYVTNPRA